MIRKNQLVRMIMNLDNEDVFTRTTNDVIRTRTPIRLMKGY